MLYKVLNCLSSTLSVAFTPCLPANDIQCFFLFDVLPKEADEPRDDDIQSLADASEIVVERKLAVFNIEPASDDDEEDQQQQHPENTFEGEVLVGEGFTTPKGGRLFR